MYQVATASTSEEELVAGPTFKVFYLRHLVSQQGVVYCLLTTLDVS